MMSWKFAAISIFLFVVSLAVPIVHAEGEVSLTEVPQLLATNFDISLFAGQLMATCILFAIIMFPVFVATKSKTAQLMMGILCIGLCIGLGWLSFWFIVIICFLCAASFANLMKERF